MCVESVPSGDPLRRRRSDHSPENEWALSRPTTGCSSLRTAAIHAALYEHSAGDEVITTAFTFDGKWPRSSTAREPVFVDTIRARTTSSAPDRAKTPADQASSRPITAGRPTWRDPRHRDRTPDSSRTPARARRQTRVVRSGHGAVGAPPASANPDLGEGASSWTTTRTSSSGRAGCAPSRDTPSRPATGGIRRTPSTRRRNYRPGEAAPSTGHSCNAGRVNRDGQSHAPFSTSAGDVRASCSRHPETARRHNTISNAHDPALGSWREHTAFRDAWQDPMAEGVGCENRATEPRRFPIFRTESVRGRFRTSPGRPRITYDGPIPQPRRCSTPR